MTHSVVAFLAALIILILFGSIWFYKAVVCLDNPNPAQKLIIFVCSTLALIVPIAICVSLVAKPYTMSIVADTPQTITLEQWDSKSIFSMDNKQFTITVGDEVTGNLLDDLRFRTTKIVVNGEPITVDIILPRTRFQTFKKYKVKEIKVGEASNGHFVTDAVELTIEE